MKKDIWCKLGFHKNKILGTAIYPKILAGKYQDEGSPYIVAFICSKCGKKSDRGLILTQKQIDKYEKN